MVRFVSFKGVKKKLGVISRIKSAEGGFFIIKRIGFFSYEVRRKIGKTFRLLATKNSKKDAIVFVRRTIKAIKLAKEAGRVAKKAGLITGAALVKASKLGFRFLEKATRPTKSRKKKTKKRKKKTPNKRKKRK